MTAKRRFRKIKPRMSDLNSISPKHLARYEDSLEVLNLMRQGFSLNNASKQVGVSSSTVKRHVGSAIYQKRHRLVAKKFDNLPRKIRLYKNGGEISIIVKGNRQATLLAQYHSAIGRLPNNRSALKEFKKIRIKDINGKIHHLETNTVKIFAILERREDAEFFSIYSR